MKDDDWSDIVLPPNDYWEFSSFRPVTHIEYSSEYKKLCSLFQVVIEKRDISERALRLTERIINICEGHYTAWLYRRTIILALMSQSINFLFDEIQFIRQYTVDCPKNYQLWLVFIHIFNYLNPHLP